MLPQLAQGPANKIFIIPSEFSQALQNIGGAIGNIASGGEPNGHQPRPRLLERLPGGRAVRRPQGEMKLDLARRREDGGLDRLRDVSPRRVDRLCQLFDVRL